MKYVQPRKQMAMGKKQSSKSPKSSSGKGSMLKSNPKGITKKTGNLYC